MSKYTKNVYTGETKIHELEHLITQLPSEARVQITLEDGRKLRGTVAVRPTIQEFRGEDEDEGMNGLLRLDDLDTPAHQYHIWLDAIRGVESLPPTLH